jgi:hypothetical protein
MDTLDRFRIEQERGRAGLAKSRQLRRGRDTTETLGVFSEPSYVGVGTAPADPAPYDRNFKRKSEGFIFSLEATGGEWRTPRGIEKTRGMGAVMNSDGTKFKESWSPARVRPLPRLRLCLSAPGSAGLPDSRFRRPSMHNYSANPREPVLHSRAWFA